jgi:hypothetical protein
MPLAGEAADSEPGSNAEPTLTKTTTRPNFITAKE